MDGHESGWSEGLAILYLTSLHSRSKSIQRLLIYQMEDEDRMHKMMIRNWKHGRNPSRSLVVDSLRNAGRENQDESVSESDD